jgi:methylenetetrahydrofolate dehydrogenase (NADP+)/methenyltetrahydrofolate cyclohydrolase
MRAELAREIAALKARGVTPGLAAVLVGEHPASQAYVRMKGRASEEAGLYHETITQPADVSERELLDLIDRLNADARVHGILVQLPLPPHIDARRVLRRVDVSKDVDGFHPENVGKLAMGDPTGFRPATPAGVQQLLIRSGVETTGRHAVVVGRSCCSRMGRAATRPSRYATRAHATSGASRAPVIFSSSRSGSRTS